MNDDDSQWMTPGEAASRLGISVATVRAAIDRGQLVARRTPGGHHRVSSASVEQLRAELYPDSSRAGP